LLATVALGGLIMPAGASAQTVFARHQRVAPTPLSGTRTTKPSTGTAVPATSAPSETPAARAAGRADLTSIDRDKVPSNTVVLTPNDFNHEYSTSFLDALNRGLPGVALSDQTGNPFQKDLTYRGFTASPVQGTPQGIAVYQNGVRINESWGDVVNWDFIPEKAIDKVSLFPSSPVFGLNAIGGALSIQMKNGFTYQGTELEVLIGSYGRVQSSVQAGNQAAISRPTHCSNRPTTRDGATSRRRRTSTACMWTSALATSRPNSTSASPAPTTYSGMWRPRRSNLLSQSYSSVFTWPQVTKLQLAFLRANVTHNISDTLSFHGNLYYRGFWQAHEDGNGTNAFPCDMNGTTGGSQFLCIGNGDPIFGSKPVLNPVANTGAFLGENDRNWVSSNTFGGTTQLTSTNKVFELDNHFVVGASWLYPVLGRQRTGNNRSSSDPVRTRAGGFIRVERRGSKSASAIRRILRRRLFLLDDTNLVSNRSDTATTPSVPSSRARDGAEMTARSIARGGANRGRTAASVIWPGIRLTAPSPERTWTTTRIGLVGLLDRALRPWLGGGPGRT
jgi:hypothetical protein